ncbi:hypothetical protein [Micromonospora saelicesensis]|nr:hypothetical protein [Micromonospora saelicesensis]
MRLVRYRGATIKILEGGLAMTTTAFDEHERPRWAAPTAALLASASVP